jgi:hypothetical protein
MAGMRPVGAVASSPLVAAVVISVVSLLARVSLGRLV